MLKRSIVIAVLLTACIWAQEPAQEVSSQTALGPSSQASAGSGPAVQMRADLNQMESLLNNMSSEVTFLRDQNLQILLNTNVRMWTILIRDLRLQLDEQERRNSIPQPATKSNDSQKVGKH